MKPIFAVAIAGTFMLALASPARAGVYTITDLGTLGGGSSAAFGLNNLGQVVGSSLTAGGQTHAFFYGGGTMIDLGLLSASDNYSTATRINDSGQVVGYSATQESNGYVDKDQPFVFSNGSLTNVGSLGGGYGMANDINGSGQIVGISADANGVTDAFLAMNGSFTDLGHFPSVYPYSDAFGVNASGQVTGYSTTAPGSGYEHAFLYSGGSLVDLGTLGGNNSRGFDINNSGQITGASFIASNTAQHAFLYSGGVMHDLGSAGAAESFGLGMNNEGDVVGTLTFGAGQNNHGFVYQNGTMVDVNSLLPANSGWILRDAQDINDLGQIVGSGLINGQDHAYLLTPVPEPSGLVLWTMLFGSVVLHRGYRRRFAHGPQ